jgi:hypothetical protein
MNASELFDIWAPQEAIWSRWAKPVLFADLGYVGAAHIEDGALPEIGSEADGRTALVLDLPAEASVKAALALASAGFRPVPLFNGNRGPVDPILGGSAVVNNEKILSWLVAGELILRRHALPVNAPPAFLLDSRRRPQLQPGPGSYDNRWIVFPQDFPSAAFLKSQGIRDVVLVLENANGQPQEDLAHVLLRWQQAGLGMHVTDLESDSPQPLQVKKPGKFGWLWYSALAVMGLRRNSAGGFGSMVPHTSSGG